MDRDNWRWKDPAKEMPPDDADFLVVLARITCDCAKGALVTICAGRENGEWMVQPCEHDFEIERWLMLPDLPQSHHSIQ